MMCCNHQTCDACLPLEAEMNISDTLGRAIMHNAFFARNWVKYYGIPLYIITNSVLASTMFSSQDCWLRTPIHYEQINFDVADLIPLERIINVVWSKCIDVNMRDRFGKTAYHYARCAPVSSFNIAKLTKLWEDSNAADNDGVTSEMLGILSELADEQINRIAKRFTRSPLPRTTLRQMLEARTLCMCNDECKYRFKSVYSSAYDNNKPCLRHLRSMRDAIRILSKIWKNLLCALCFVTWIECTGSVIYAATNQIIR